VLRAKLYLDGECVKRFLPPSAAEFSLDGDLFFMISRSEIMKNKSTSKYYLARSAEKNLFTQPSNKILRGEAAELVPQKWGAPP